MDNLLTNGHEIDQLCELRSERSHAWTINTFTIKLNKYSESSNQQLDTSLVSL